MDWSVRLSAAKSDLEKIASINLSPEIKIGKVGHEYFLTTDDFKDLATPDDVRKVASTIVSQLSGVFDIVIGLKEPIQFDAVRSIDENGNQHYDLAFKSELKIKVTGDIIVKDGNGNIIKESRHTDSVAQFVRLSRINQNFAKAFQYVNIGLDNWTNLYAVYELATKDVGKSKVEKWIGGQDQLNKFKATANNEELGGLKARHATNSGNPNQNLKIDTKTARVWIEMLIHKWANHLDVVD